MMKQDELKSINEKLNKLAMGIALHLETLQGQIGDRMDQMDQAYNERLLQINQMLEGKQL
ncbi:hypothetical protein E1I69_21040 [Bacillus timonensis]|uniref:Uncharacterized protein n=1 Tax=Bacillus timonensis TaxID=1033734 RepID=A0A4S3PL61_9BACI|nr:hypothetical protein [Bacillus timonensis]THE09786.1 hypothetical protein E1I69_21040 [Bacillus timonensis]